MFRGQNNDEIGPQQAADLRDQGAVLVDVRNVAGGMMAWVEAGLPVVRDDGSTGAVA